MASKRMLSYGTQLQLPGRRRDPLSILWRRLAGASALVVLVAALAYVDRRGYVDASGGSLSPLDAIYYATVTLTTTGYGDIYPASAAARATTAFVITPLRVIFLILLVGTTVEILTESTRHAWRVRRWRDIVNNHTIVCGYGAKACGAIDAIVGNGTPRDHIVVIEPDAERAEAAVTAGHPVVRGSSTRTANLREARVEEADAVIVTVDADDTAVLTVLTVRELNPRARISATAREEENAHLLRQSGANTVVASTSAAGRLAGIATYSSALVDVLNDLLNVGSGVELVEHEIGPDEAGPCEGQHFEQVIVVVRGDESMVWNDPRVDPLRVGDRVVEITTAGAPSA